MKKRLSLISCMFIAGIGANAQVSEDAAKDIAFPASVEKTLHADKYGSINTNQNSSVLSPSKFGSRASASSNGIVIGTTKYDLMTNSSIDNRFISNPDGTFSAAFTFDNGAGPAYLTRGTGYLYNNGSSWTVKNPTARIESERNGWPSILYTGNGDEIVISHSTDSDQLLLSKRSSKGAGAWTEIKDPTGAQVAPKVGTGYLIWPRAVVGGPNNNTIHLVALTEPVPVPGGAGTFQGVPVEGMDGALVYSRSDDGGNTWTVKNKIIKGIDASAYTGINGDSYAITAKGNTVAIAVFERFGDVRVVKSNDNGRSWSTHIPLDYENDAFTLGDFAILDTPTTCDQSGDILIDNNGMVHVFFGTWRWNDDDPTDGQYSTFQLANGLAYWKESYGDNGYQRLIDRIDRNGNGAFDYTGVPQSGFDALTDYASKSLTSFPSVGMNTAGDIFLKFTFLMEDETITTGKPYNLNNKHFRHEWVTRSNDGGCTWSNPVDITDAGAGIEECVYGVIPKHIDSKFRMIYMEDGIPGTSVAGEEHAETTNEIVYMEMATSAISGAKDICLTAVSGSREICGGDTVELNASGSCGSAYTWKNQAGTTIGTSAVVSVTAPGTYTCDIMTPCGLQQETVEMVTPQNGNGPKIAVTSSVAELCASGSQATLKVTSNTLGTNGSIVWDRGIPSAIDTFVITSPGNYTIEVSNCGGTTRDTITIDTVSAVNTAVLGKTAICPGEQSTLSVAENPDGTYTWKDGSGATISSTRTVNVNATGTYTVDVTACNGSLTGTNSISIVAEPAPTAAISVVGGGAPEACIDPDGSIDLQVAAQIGATFKWSNNETGRAISLSTATVGTQPVEVTSYNSCGDSVSANISVEIFPLPAAPSITESNAVLTANQTAGVEWFVRDRNGRYTTTNQTGAVFTIKPEDYRRGDKFAARVTDPTTGCTSDYTVYEEYTVNVFNLNEVGESISIFPNPNSGEFSINFEAFTGKKSVELSINNNVGQVVYESKVDFSGSHSEPVSLKGLDKGVYFLNVSDGSEQSTHRIVVQ